jgi:hypothetical protein
VAPARLASDLDATANAIRINLWNRVPGKGTCSPNGFLSEKQPEARSPNEQADSFGSIRGARCGVRFHSARCVEGHGDGSDSPPGVISDPDGADLNRWSTIAGGTHQGVPASWSDKHVFVVRFWVNAILGRTEERANREQQECICNDVHGSPLSLLVVGLAISAALVGCCALRCALSVRGPSFLGHFGVTQVA